MHLIFTGGTIDSYTPKEVKSFIPFYLNSLSVRIPLKTTFLFKKSSPEITDRDRFFITRFINGLNETKILLFHGTDTMDRTLQFLTEHLKRKDQIIVLLGSMIPFLKDPFSDAPFNLGFAFAMANVLTPGVYIAMNGQIFQSPCVKKNFNLLRFENPCVS